MSIFRKLKQKKVVKKHSINFDGRMGLSINGLLVKDFDYLLNWYSNNQLLGFADRELLFFHHEQIIKEINNDFKNKKLKEELAYPISISRNLAEAKLCELKKIIIALVEYYKIEAA